MFLKKTHRGSTITDHVTWFKKKRKQKQHSSICMSNSNPPPPRAFSKVLVYRSIWPKPRSHAIELTVWLKVSGVSTIEFKMGGTESCSEKSHSFKSGASGTAGPRHPLDRLLIPRTLQRTGCLFPFSISAACIDLQPCACLRSRLKPDPDVPS